VHGIKNELVDNSAFSDLILCDAKEQYGTSITRALNAFSARRMFLISHSQYKVLLVVLISTEGIFVALTNCHSCIIEGKTIVIFCFIAEKFW
jgi:hypothetical protein